MTRLRTLTLCVALLAPVATALAAAAVLDQRYPAYAQTAPLDQGTLLFPFFPITGGR